MGKIITIKSFVIIAILSFIVANVADLIDAAIEGKLIVGKSGFPFRDSLSLGFEGGTTYPNMFILNILFWFIVLFILWKLFQKTFKK